MADVAIASFHLVDVGARRATAGLAHIGLDRRRLASTPGLLTARSMGAGNDNRMVASFRPDRRVLFAVWSDDAALDRFFVDSPVARRWADASAWHVRLRLIEGHGRWRGEHLLDDIEPAVGSDGPVVTITRAALRGAALPSFVAHSRSVTRSLPAVPGLRAAVGFGEVPIVRLGTFAVWDDATSVDRAVDEWSDHASAMRAAVARRMFTESLFARFEPYAPSGTWSGRDPLSDMKVVGAGVQV